MRILLIQASQPAADGLPYRGNRSWLHGITLPLLAALTPEGHDVHLLNDAVHRLPSGRGYDLVGISAMGVGIFRANEIADHFRRAGCKVVMGGKVLSQHADLAEDHVDALVLGEAEDVWPELVNDALQGNLKRVYGDTNRLSDIQQLPIPRYDLVDRRKHGPFFPVETSRGCTNRCHFCIISAWTQQQHRIRPIAHVVRDIQNLIKLNIRRITFVDDNITLDRDYALELFDAIRPLEISWISQISTSILYDIPLMNAAAASGCAGLSIGFESIIQANLDQAGKGFNQVKDYARGLEHLKELGIVVAPLFVLGFDHDTPESFEQIVEFLNAGPIALPLLYILTPVPGTQLYDRLQKEGRITDHNLSHYNLVCAVFEPRLMSSGELQKNFWSILDRVYSLPSILSRVSRQTGSPGKRIVTLLMNVSNRLQVKRRILPGSF